MGAGTAIENKGEAVVRKREGQMVVHEAGKRWCENGYRKGNRCPRKEIGPFWAVCNSWYVLFLRILGPGFGELQHDGHLSPSSFGSETVTAILDELIESGFLARH